MKTYKFVSENLDVWEIGKWRKNEGADVYKAENSSFEDPYESLMIPNYASRWFICEIEGKQDKSSLGTFAEKIKLSKEIPIQMIQEFAFECTEHVFPIFDSMHPDKKITDAVEQIKLYFDNPTDDRKKQLSELLSELEMSLFLKKWRVERTFIRSLIWLLTAILIKKKDKSWAYIRGSVAELRILPWASKEDIERNPDQDPRGEMLKEGIEAIHDGAFRKSCKQEIEWQRAKLKEMLKNI